MFVLQDLMSAARDYSANVVNGPVSMRVCVRQRARGEDDIITTTGRWLMEGHRGFMPWAFSLWEREHTEYVRVCECTFHPLLWEGGAISLIS